MDFFKKLRGDMTNMMGDDKLRLTSLDRLTRVTAIAISRRNFLKRALSVGATIVGASLLEAKPAFADHCNYCQAPCACTSTVNSCCSPNGLYCYYKSCVRQYCNLPGVKLIRAFVYACNDGSPIHQCEDC